MGNPIVDIRGKKFHRLTVIEKAEKPSERSNGQHWLCECDCGSRIVLRGASIRYGSVKSCGCLKSDKARQRMAKMRLDQSGTLEQRFLSRFEKNDSGCWEWLAHKDKDGYGILPRNGPSVRAHRFSIQYFNGVDPSGKVVCHSCDNPGCVNPDHLFLGMPIDNVGDMLSKQRDKMIGSRNNKAKLDEHSALLIYESKVPYRRLAEMFHVSTSTIKRIKQKTLWRHIHDKS